MSEETKLLEHYRRIEQQTIHENTVDWDHQVPRKGKEDLVRDAWDRLEAVERLMLKLADMDVDLTHSPGTVFVPCGADARLTVGEAEE